MSFVPSESCDLSKCSGTASLFITNNSNREVTLKDPSGVKVQVPGTSSGQVCIPNPSNVDVYYSDMLKLDRFKWHGMGGIIVTSDLSVIRSESPAAGNFTIENRADVPVQAFVEDVLIARVEAGATWTNTEKYIDGQAYHGPFMEVFAADKDNLCYLGKQSFGPLGGAGCNYFTVDAIFSKDCKKNPDDDDHGGSQDHDHSGDGETSGFPLSLVIVFGVIGVLGLLMLIGAIVVAIK